VIATIISRAAASRLTTVAHVATYHCEYSGRKWLIARELPCEWRATFRLIRQPRPLAAAPGRQPVNDFLAPYRARQPDWQLPTQDSTIPLGPLIGSRKLRGYATQSPLCALLQLPRLAAGGSERCRDGEASRRVLAGLERTNPAPVDRHLGRAPDLITEYCKTCDGVCHEGEKERASENPYFYEGRLCVRDNLGCTVHRQLRRC